MTRLGEELVLSAVRLIRPAVSEFETQHGDGIAPHLPLRRSESGAGGGKKAGGSHGA